MSGIEAHKKAAAIEQTLLHFYLRCCCSHAFSSCRGTAWQPLAVTEAYMGLDPQVFNSEVRRRALEWKSNQEADFRAKASATLKERVQSETHAYLTRMGILDTTNPVLKNLQVRVASLLIRPSLQTPCGLRADS